MAAIGLTASATVTVPATTGDDITQLSTLDLTKITFFNDGGKTAVRANETTLGGNIVMKDTIYASGIGTHAPSVACFKLDGATRFNASVGIDDDADLKDNHGVVDMTITLYKSNAAEAVKENVRLNRTDAGSYKLDILLTGYTYMKIEFDKGSQAWADHVDLGDAYFTGGSPVTVDYVPATTGTGITQVSSLDLTPVTCFDDGGKTKARANLSTLGGPLSMKDTIYESGVGTHTPSLFCFSLDGATRFQASVGIDDAAKQEANHGIVDMTVTLIAGSEATEYRRATPNRTDAASHKLDIPLTGYDYMKINFAQGAQAWADQLILANAYFTGGTPAIIAEDAIGSDDKVQLPAEGANGNKIVALSSLEIANMTTGWGTIRANRSIDDNTLIIRGTKYASGIGVHADSRIVVKLNGAATKFHAVGGIDDETNTQADVNYTVTLIGEAGANQVVAHGNATRSSEAVTIDIDNLTAWKYLVLDVDKNGGDSNDHFDWDNAYLEYDEYNSNPPETVPASVLESGLEVASVWFAQPGVRMMQFVRNANEDAEITVSDLPAGLTWNAARRCVEGIVAAEGTYTYTFSSTNAAGEPDSKSVTLTVSSSLKMPTPAMGWMSWNTIQGRISEDIVKEVADKMTEQGLVAAGFNTIMMDDLWHGERDTNGNPQPNATRFPNGIKPVADYVHSKNMKFGLYSDVAPNTCAGAFGSHGYYDKDAAAYAAWGIDMVKVDYCGAPGDKATAISRYSTFINEIDNATASSDRKISMIICEWGQRDPWTWAPEVGAPTWRVTYDARDCWVGQGQGVGVTQSLDLMKDLWIYNGTNRYNDADMMCIGIHGPATDGSHYSSADLCASGAGMTQDEYQTQMSMWCMWSSPLLLSYDARKDLSEDDLRILTNPEIIAINQDRMGLAAQYLGTRDGYMLFAKDLENGDVAVAVVNRNDAAGSYTIDFSAIPALAGTDTWVMNDVWSDNDPGAQTGSYEIASIPSHATAVYRLSREAEPEPAPEVIPGAPEETESVKFTEPAAEDDPATEDIDETVASLAIALDTEAAPAYVDIPAAVNHTDAPAEHFEFRYDRDDIAAVEFVSEGEEGAMTHKIRITHKGTDGTALIALHRKAAQPVSRAAEEEDAPVWKLYVTVTGAKPSTEGIATSISLTGYIPSQLYLTQSFTVGAAVEPAESTDAVQWTFTANPADAVKVVDNGDGTYTVTALSEGTLTVTARLATHADDAAVTEVTRTVTLRNATGNPGEGVTGIDAVNADAAQGRAEIHDLAGRRLTRIEAAGIYIVNGHKTVVR